MDAFSTSPTSYRAPPFTHDMQTPHNTVYRGNFKGAIPEITSFKAALGERLGRDYQIEVEETPAPFASASFKIAVTTNGETSIFLGPRGVYYLEFFCKNNNNVIGFNVQALTIEIPTAELIVNCLRGFVSDLVVETLK